MGLLPDDMYTENWTEKDERLALVKINREIRKEKEKKRRKNWGWFDMAFPEFKGMPILWIIVIIICVLFSFISMVII